MSTFKNIAPSPANPAERVLRSLGRTPLNEKLLQEELRPWAGRVVFVGNFSALNVLHQQSQRAQRTADTLYDNHLLDETNLVKIDMIMPVTYDDSGKLVESAELLSNTLAKSYDTTSRINPEPIRLQGEENPTGLYEAIANRIHGDAQVSSGMDVKSSHVFMVYPYHFWKATGGTNFDYAQLYDGNVLALQKIGRRPADNRLALLGRTTVRAETVVPYEAPRVVDYGSGLESVQAEAIIPADMRQEAGRQDGKGQN